MKYLVTGARRAPYSITDADTGRTSAGVAGLICGVKLRPLEAGQGENRLAVGHGSKEIKCDGPTADAAIAALNKAGEWCVMDLEIGTKGQGENMKEYVFDVEPIAPMSRYVFDLAKGAVRVPAAPAPAPENGAGRATSAAPAR